MNCFGTRKKNSYTVNGEVENREDSNQKNGKSKEKNNPDDEKVEQVTEVTEGDKTIKENCGTDGSCDQKVDLQVDENAKINTAAIADKDKKEEKKLKKKEELDSKKEKKEKEKREKKEKKEREKEKKKGSTEKLDDKKEKKDKKSKKDQKIEKDGKGEVNSAGPDVGVAAEEDCRSFPEVGLVPGDAAEAALVPGDVETADESDARDPVCSHPTGNATEAPDFETEAKESIVLQHPSRHAESRHDDARDDDTGVTDDVVTDDVIRDDDVINGRPDVDELESVERNGDDSSRNSLNEGCYDPDQETEGQGRGHEGQGHEGQGHGGQQRLTEPMQ